MQDRFKISRDHVLGEGMPLCAPEATERPDALVLFPFAAQSENVLTLYYPVGEYDGRVSSGHAIPQ